MNRDLIPIVKFDIQGMKTQILNHLGVCGSDLGVALDEEITRAVEQYPWQDRVTAIVHDALELNLKGYFQYGEGAEAIKKTINKAIGNALA